jgi:hypothetical protein
MSINSASVTIKGTSGLLMHRFPLEPVEAIEKKTPAEQAEIAAYRHPTSNELYIPGGCLQRALVAGATFSKGKGRATLQKTAAACLAVTPEYLLLGTKKYEIDSRSVVISATRGRIIRHRPRLDEWQVDFDLNWDDTLLTEKQVREVVDNTGSRVGLLDFRPACKGPYGRFVVTKWESS